MLPDIPSIKSKLQEAVNRRIRAKVRAGDPLLAMVPRIVQHEGETRELTGPNASPPGGYKRFEAAYQFNRQELRTLTFEQIIARIDGAADQVLGQIARSAYATIHEAVTQVGNVVDNKGEPFTFDSFLRALEAVEIDFDADTGKAEMPTLFVAPELGRRIAEQIPTWEKNEEYTRRFDALMEKKREEWRAREDRRKLVD